MTAQLSLPVDLSVYQLPVNCDGWILIHEARARSMVLRILRNPELDAWQVHMPSDNGHPFGWTCWVPNRQVAQEIIDGAIQRHKQGMSPEHALWGWCQ